jgi:hypothetical protein
LENGNATEGGGHCRQIVLVLGACVLLGIGVVAFWPGEQEPGYNGKKLSQWLIVAAGQSTKESFVAVKIIGTNALPWLVSWAQFEQPAWRKYLLKKYEKIPRRLRSDSLGRLIIGHKERIQQAVPLGFGILDPEAKPTVPALTKLLRKSKSLNRQRYILACLANIGSGAAAALPYLEELAANPQPALASDAAQAMHYIQREILHPETAKYMNELAQ